MVSQKVIAEMTPLTKAPGAQFEISVDGKPRSYRDRKAVATSQWFEPLRKNLGMKNCQLSPRDVDRITRTFLDFKETPESKIFPNAAFGYWKVTVERPLRLHSQLSLKAIETLRFASGDEEVRTVLYEEFRDSLFTEFSKISAAVEKRIADWGSDDDDAEDENGGETKKGLTEKRKKKLLDAATWERDCRLVDTTMTLRSALGEALYEDHNIFRDRVDVALKKAGVKLSAADRKQILRSVSWRVTVRRVALRNCFQCPTSRA